MGCRLYDRATYSLGWGIGLGRYTDSTQASIPAWHRDGAKYVSPISLLTPGLHRPTPYEEECVGSAKQNH